MRKSKHERNGKSKAKERGGTDKTRKRRGENEPKPRNARKGPKQARSATKPSGRPKTSRTLRTHAKTQKNEFPHQQATERPETVNISYNMSTDAGNAGEKKVAGKGAKQGQGEVFDAGRPRTSRTPRTRDGKRETARETTETRARWDRPRHTHHGHLSETSVRPRAPVSTPNPSSSSPSAPNP